MRNWHLVLYGFLAFLVMICGSCYAIPQWGVYHRRLDGEAELAQAEYSRRIAVLEAQAKMDAAKKLAEADIERAKGTAKANEILGASLRENEAYLRYLWIQGLQDGHSEVIYVPTETNLPILEATRRLQPPAQPVQ